MKKTLLSGMAALVVGLGVSTTSAAQSVFFSADTDGTHDPIIMAPVGSTLTGHIYADIDDTHGGLIGWGVEANYDPNKATLLDPCCETDPQWNLPEEIDPSSLGTVNMVDGRIGDGIAAPPAIYLGNIAFEITDSSPWTLWMQNVFPDDPNFNGFVAADDFVYDETIAFLSSQVNVPIPAAAWLFGTGLLGLIGIARRKKAA